MPQSPSVRLWENCSSDNQCFQTSNDPNWKNLCCVAPEDQSSGKKTCRPISFCSASAPAPQQPATTGPRVVNKAIAAPFSPSNPVNDQAPQPNQAYGGDINQYLSSAVSRIKFPNTGNFKQDSLDTHNILRQLMARKLLVWDDRLAAQAQKYSAFLAATNKFEHSHVSLAPFGLLGENLYRVTNGDPSPRAAILAWFNEFPLYKPGTPIGQPSKEAFEKYGHFTEMQFATVSKIGCGATFYNGNTNVYVCNYDVVQAAGQVLDMSIPNPRPFGL
jgi:uncharacterized protein YkwD